MPIEVNDPKKFKRDVIIAILVSIAAIVIFFLSPENETRSALLVVPIMAFLYIALYDDSEGPFYGP